MAQTDWYLVAYDIADDRRRRALHRALRAEGMALQKSVFAVQRDRRGIVRLLDELDHLIEPRDDDLRAYPINSPAELWLHGDSAIADGLRATGATPATGAKQARERPRRGWWRRRKQAAPA